MRRLILCAVLVLAACGKPDPAAPPAGPPAPQKPQWSSIVSGAGMAIALEGEAAEQPPIRLACLRSPARFLVTVERIIPISSEDRLSIGIDGEPFALAVTPESLEAPQGISAEGPLTQDLIGRIGAAQEIAGMYGQTRIGPYEAPAAALRASFAEACRKALAGP